MRRTTSIPTITPIIVTAIRFRFNGSSSPESHAIAEGTTLSRRAFEKRCEVRTSLQLSPSDAINTGLTVAIVIVFGHRIVGNLQGSIFDISSILRMNCHLFRTRIMGHTRYYH